MQIKKIVEFDMGHRVPNHKSKCKNLHGHRYKLEVVMEGDVISKPGVSDEGMVIDFSDIKQIVETYIDTYLDHGYMGNISADAMFFPLFQKLRSKFVAVNFIPTAENIAEYIFNELSPLFVDTYGTQLHLKKVILWETPTSSVEYEGVNKIIPMGVVFKKSPIRNIDLPKDENNICLCDNKTAKCNCK